MSQGGLINSKGGSGGGNVQTITGNSGGAVGPSGNNINLVGSSGITVTGNPGTSTLTVTPSGNVPTTFTENTGTATPAANNLNIVATVNAAGTTPHTTTGSGSTVTIATQYAQAIASTNATNVGLAAFNSAQFTVDANGFVSVSSGGSALVLLQTQTANNVANITFNSTFITSTYKNYLIVMTDVVPVTNAVTLSAQVSTNNGTTYLNTNYNCIAIVTSATPGTTGASSTTSIIFNTSNLINNTAGRGLSGNIYLNNLTTGSGFPAIYGSGSHFENTAGVFVVDQWGGNLPTTIVVNNIRFSMSAGNISTGTFSLYGIAS
jgi:hypothetical protein